MRPRFRFPLTMLAAAAVLAGSAGCQTHDRRMYTMRKDKDLHVPDPWAPTPAKAADEAAGSISTAPAETGAPAGAAPEGPAPGAMPQ